MGVKIWTLFMVSGSGQIFGVFLLNKLESLRAIGLISTYIQNKLINV
jgi:hypothetical protein